MTALARRRPGLWVYLDGHDVARMASTVAKLRRCGAVGALPLIEGVNGHRVPVDTVAHACDVLAAADIDAMPFAFPNLTGNLAASIGHMHAVRQATRRRGQWDIEPIGMGRVGGVLGGDPPVLHWSQSSVDLLLEAEPDATITSTRVELLHFDPRGHELWLQREQQNSMDAPSSSVERWPDAVWVTGVFDQAGDARTLLEVGRDLDRCTPQARKTGTHGIWSAHTLNDAECDLLREWSLATWV